MKRNDRLSVALHVLLHMAQRADDPMTSEEMAACVETNAVVIRRTFAGLREAGIVTSVKGHGGGWKLARALSEITLHEVQQALDERLFSVAANGESPGCLVERAVNEAIGEAMAAANRLMDERLAGITLADLTVDVNRLFCKQQAASGKPSRRH
ncbi:Rrf2 family transcriptional regulator [Herbaspirillum lusitanum]|uniref:Rrf2 family transcriptional regulator n=1 Tax=Herbaspirillum lusitanum TaxID=213312 RepID=A0ABW9AGG9_9BURK